jgi:hypothetical protein
MDGWMDGWMDESLVAFCLFDWCVMSELVCGVVLFMTIQISVS